jgi:putative hydrolase of the HAD superfamily
MKTNNSPPVGGGRGKYKHLFFDLDHTLWDYEANARSSMQHIYETHNLKERGVHDFDLFYKNYSVHNDRMWELYRNGKIKQDVLRVKRMSLSLLDFKIADDALADQMNVLFLDLLPTRTHLFPYCTEVLDYLIEKKYILHLITNGFEEVQFNKLKYSGLTKYFTEVITSEGSNSLKPNKEIFDFAFQKAAANPKESIMIGDNVEVDILGARNAGIDQVFVNHLNVTTDAKPTYTVYNLKELEGIF